MVRLSVSACRRLFLLTCPMCFSSFIVYCLPAVMSVISLCHCSDFKQISKITFAILILRGGKSPERIDTLNSYMNNWTKSHLGWMTTSPITKGEWTADKYVFLYDMLLTDLLR